MEYKDFAVLVDSARKINAAARNGDLHPFGIPNPGLGHNIAGFAREFCTVCVDVGRAVGKTTYIINNAEPWDLIIVHNEHMARHVECNQPMCCKVLTVDQMLHTNSWRGIGIAGFPRTIWIDDASRIAQRQIDKIYHTLATHPSQTFILLG